MVSDYHRSLIDQLLTAYSSSNFIPISLHDLALCRIAGPTKEGFIRAVSRIAPQLHRLALNVLPYVQTEDLKNSPLRDFDKFPVALQNGQPFPRHSLMGSSTQILPLCRNLKSLYLRDPLARPGVVYQLRSLTWLDLCHTPTGRPIIDVNTIRSRTQLPLLEKLYMYQEDCSWAVAQDLHPGICLAGPVHVRSHGKGRIDLSLAPPYDVSSTLYSSEELAQIWL